MSILKKIEVEDFASFQREIEKIRSEIERTINLTYFYVNSRFKISTNDFKENYSVDGANDGGIDFYFSEGNTHYIIQSKYHEKSYRESERTIKNELHKIEKTIIAKNTNKSANEFVNSLKRNLHNSETYLEIIWLTTNEVTELVRKEALKTLINIAGKNNWNINVDINFIDRYSLESVIYDIKHGYVPHTGKKELTFEIGEYMQVSKDSKNIEAFICNIKAVDILSWFNSSNDIKKYLQKNVRESIGDKSPVNKGLRISYIEDSSLFWYKHNGIILFVDWLELDKNNNSIIIRNPQIVNGAQTITQLYKAYDNEGRNNNNSTKILVRIYRLPYEDSETYQRSIDIIEALNSQNKIKASDLHSTDPRQVMLENRLDDLGLEYVYFRKRSEKEKRVSSLHHIFMRKLGMIYHVCEFNKPDEGVAGNVELYFEEKKRYNQSFPENIIKRPISNKIDHIVFKYIDCWYLYNFINRNLKNELNKKHQELFSYLLWYILADVYKQQQLCKENNFKEGWRDWINFIQSREYANGIINYMKIQYPKYFKMISKNEQEPRNYLKSSEARNKFNKISNNTNLFREEFKKSFLIYKKKRGY